MHNINTNQNVWFGFISPVNVLSSDLRGCWRNDTPRLYHTLPLQWSILCIWLGDMSLLHPSLPSVHQSDLHSTPFQPLWMCTWSPDAPSFCACSAFSYWRFYSAALPLCWLCSSSRTLLCTASDISHACGLRSHLDLGNNLHRWTECDRTSDSPGTGWSYMPDSWGQRHCLKQRVVCFFCLLMVAAASDFCICIEK